MAFKINGNTVISDALAITAPNLQVDDTTLFVDATNNRVGVGTITPGTTLDVLGIVRTNSQFTSTVATGTAPLVITSTTRVSNLNVATAGTADALTTTRTLWGQNFTGAANVTGNLTSVGNITGTGAVTLTATAGTLALAATGANIITLSTNATTRVSVGSDGTVTVSGNILPNANNTRNIGSATFKYNTMYATLFSGTAVEAYYADLAEIYETDADYEPGTLVEFGGPNEVTVTTNEFSKKIAGVISTNPAYLMNKDAVGQPIALKGRVPCKVVGPVSAGDFIVSSNIPGVGKASDTWIGGAVIGKVIKTDNNEDIRFVEVVVGVM